MISFSQQEIFASVVSALGYGVLFAIIYCFVGVVRRGIISMKEVVEKTIKFERIFPLPTFKYKFSTIDLDVFSTVFLIILYSIGFSLLSYFALDGEIRLYMLVLSFAAFYLSKFAFYRFFDKILFTICNPVFLIFSLIVRIMISFFQKVYGFLQSNTLKLINQISKK